MVLLPDKLCGLSHLRLGFQFSLSFVNRVAQFENERCTKNSWRKCPYSVGCVLWWRSVTWNSGVVLSWSFSDTQLFGTSIFGMAVCFAASNHWKLGSIKYFVPYCICHMMKSDLLQMWLSCRTCTILRTFNFNIHSYVNVLNRGRALTTVFG